MIQDLKSNKAADMLPQWSKGRSDSLDANQKLILSVLRKKGYLEEVLTEHFKVSKTALLPETKC